MYGNFSFPHLQYQGFTAGVRLGPITVVMGGANVHFVRSTGPADYDPPELTGRIFATLNAALGQCRSGRGDTVVCLEGHTESFTAANSLSNMVAGTRIVGRGYGNMRPTFTWTAATSTVLMSVANCVFENCILNLEPGSGTVSVAAPISITAAGCGLVDCRMRASTDASNLATVPISLSDAADDCFLIGNRIFGATAGENTTLVDIAGADRLVMAGNVFKGATSSTGVGVVRFKTTAATDISLTGNTYINKKALSTCAVTGVAAVSGVSRDEHFAYLDNASLTPWLTSTGLMTFHRPTVTNFAGEVGTEVVGTVSA